MSYDIVPENSLLPLNYVELAPESPPKPLTYVQLAPEDQEPQQLKYTQLGPEGVALMQRQLPPIYDRALPVASEVLLSIPAPVVQVSSPFVQQHQQQQQQQQQQQWQSFAQPVPPLSRTSFGAQAAPLPRTSFGGDQWSAPVQDQWSAPAQDQWSAPAQDQWGAQEYDWNANAAATNLSPVLSPQLSPRAADPRQSMVDPRQSMVDPRQSMVDPRQSMVDPRQSIAAFSDQGVPARFKDGLFDLTRFGWFHGMLSSKHANELLRGRAPGSFLVRCSTKGDGSFVLVHVPIKGAGEPAHVLITPVPGVAGTGFLVQGNSNIWSSLPQIVNAWASKKHLLHAVDSRNCERADPELRFWQMKALDE
jgi:hypothetical protein